MDKELLEKSISGLSPELQEKARACQSMNELLELIAENDVELSDDALEAVAGGCFTKNKAYHTICGDELSSWGFPEKSYFCNRCRKTVTDEEIEYK